MTLRTYQVCRTREGWCPVEVASQSQKDLRYLVLVNPWGNPRENICECPSYTFRGECKHQLWAVQSLCLWSEEDGRVEQDEEQRKNKVCPQCGSPTKYEIEVVDD